MIVTLTPQRRDDRLVLSKRGDILTVNGEDFDFSGIAEGATLAREAAGCGWLASDVARMEGALRLSLILPHGAGAPQETLYPETITVTKDGPVTLPPYEAAAMAE